MFLFFFFFNVNAPHLIYTYLHTLSLHDALPILGTLEWSETRMVRRLFWRMLTPRWALDLLGGQGAATRGGRHNEPGMAGLYMPERFETAVAEHEQELGIRPECVSACKFDPLGGGIGVQK